VAPKREPFHVGDDIDVVVDSYDRTDAPADPEALELTITRPDGNETTAQLADMTPEQTGRHVYAVALTEPGRWRVRTAAEVNGRTVVERATVTVLR
jgi:hypothetical protein